MVGFTVVEFRDVGNAWHVPKFKATWSCTDWKYAIYTRLHPLLSQATGILHGHRCRAWVLGFRV